MGLDMYFYEKTEVGYLRKVNSIHTWIVNHCAEGTDDCNYVELDSNSITELIDTIDKVCLASKMVKGKIVTSITFTGKKEIKHFETGMIVKDPSVAKELLPNGEGFFFGSQEYNQYYISDLVEAKKILEKMQATGEDYLYRASW